MHWLQVSLHACSWTVLSVCNQQGIHCSSHYASTYVCLPVLLCAGLGRLPLLQQVSAVDTLQVAPCQGSSCADEAQVLPWYLQLDRYAKDVPLPDLPFADNRYMICRKIIQQQVSGDVAC